MLANSSKICFFILCILFSNNGFCAITFNLKEIRLASEFDGGANSINRFGNVAGSYLKQPGQQNAFYYDGSVVDLGNLGGSPTSSASINDLNQVVGFSINSFGFPSAFLYYNGAMLSLGSLGGLSSSANSINNKGQIVGSSQVSHKDSHVFLYENGLMQDLGSIFAGNFANGISINDNGQIVGMAYLHNPIGGNLEHHGFLYDHGSITDIGTLGGISSAAQDINLLGYIVGAADPLSGSAQAFIYHDNVMKALPSLDLNPSVAVSINNSNQIVGRSGNRAVLWMDDQVYDLSQLVPHGWRLMEALDINDAGQIVGGGYYGDDERYRAFVLTPSSLSDQSSIPEPSTLVVWGGVLATLWIVGRYFR